MDLNEAETATLSSGGSISRASNQASKNTSTTRKNLYRIEKHRPITPARHVSPAPIRPRRITEAPQLVTRKQTQHSAQAFPLTNSADAYVSMSQENKVFNPLPLKPNRSSFDLPRTQHTKLALLRRQIVPSRGKNNKSTVQKETSSGKSTTHVASINKLIDITKDYYGELGLSPLASLPEIRTQYRKLVLECHPDRNPGRENDEKFMRRQFAYDALVDADIRVQYDAGREAFLSRLTARAAALAASTAVTAASSQGYSFVLPDYDRSKTSPSMAKADLRPGTTTRLRDNISRKSA